MKYRYLTDNELQELEEEFKQFLITNHLYDQEWKLLNQNNPTKALEIVGLFSDLVLEKSLKLIQFLLHVSENKIKCFWFLSDKAYMVGFDYNGGETLTKENFLNFLSDKPSDFSIFKLEKSFSPKEREKEVFYIMESGASPVSRNVAVVLFKLLNMEVE